MVEADKSESRGTTQMTVETLLELEEYARSTGIVNPFKCKVCKKDCYLYRAERGLISNDKGESIVCDECEAEGKEMRIITQNEHTKVICLDEPGAGGACHEYRVYPIDVNPTRRELSIVSFQNGPIKEHGVNGCQNEDLISIVIDRLEHFQAGPFPCDENSLALARLRAALHFLKFRTADRKARGVEGESKK